MAYKLKEQKIIPNGLNLLAPGDQVADGDCLDLQDWWAGAAGRLEQAPQLVEINSPSVLSLQDSLCKADNRIYYGGGGNLRQVGRGGGTETPIAAGFDGKPLGLLSYQGFLWVMNQQVTITGGGKGQCKDDGTAVTDWTPAAPAAPTLTSNALVSAALAVTECDPGLPDSTGKYTQIKMWTSGAIPNMEIGAYVTITGNASAAMNGVPWQVTDIFPGSPNLLYLAATLPAGTVFGLGGTFTYGNPGLPMGDYLYWITWQYSAFGESNPSVLAGTAITVAAAATYTKVDISGLTPPAGVAGWNLYRQSPGLGTPYRLNENVLDLSRTDVKDYGDAVHMHADDQLLSLGIIMEADHDPPPLAMVLANQVYNGRIVAANSALNPNRIWWTPALQPGFFRGSANPVGGDWLDVGTDKGDGVLAITVRPGMLVIYRQRSIWRHVGDLGDPSAVLQCVVPDLGIVGPRAVAQTSTGDFFISQDGVYKFNNDWAQKLSQKVDPVWRGQATENLVTLAAAYRSQCALGHKNGRLWASYPKTSTIIAPALIYHVESQRWFSGSTGYAAYLDTGTDFLGAGPGVFSLENSYVGGATALAFQSEYQDCGLPDHEKTWADLVLSHNTQAKTLTITIRINKGATSYTLATTISSTVITKQIIPLLDPATGLPIRAYNLSVRITGAGTSLTSPITIDTPILLHYYVEARQAKRFDTSLTDHGMGEVKTVDQVELDIDATAGAATLQVSSDIPGGTLAARLGAGQAIAASTGRELRRIVLSSPADGRLLRYQVTTTTGMQIYGARARLLPIGVYLDGTVGDFWQPQPQSIGV